MRKTGPALAIPIGSPASTSASPSESTNQTAKGSLLVKAIWRGIPPEKPGTSAARKSMLLPSGVGSVTTSAELAASKSSYPLSPNNRSPPKPGIIARVGCLTPIWIAAVCVTGCLTSRSAPAPEVRVTLYCVWIPYGSTAAAPGGMTPMLKLSVSTYRMRPSPAVVPVLSRAFRRMLPT